MSDLLYCNFRSLANGNCLFSSISMYLVGDNGLVTILRSLTAIELHLNAKYYASHPNLHYALENGKALNGEKLFSSFLSVFEMSRSFLGQDENLSLVDNILKESLNICRDNTWSSFLCVLALSNVINLPIKLHFPDSGSLKQKFLYNQVVLPINKSSNLKEINILWSPKSFIGDMDATKINHFSLMLKKNNKKVRKNLISQPSTTFSTTKKVNKLYKTITDSSTVTKSSSNISLVSNKSFSNDACKTFSETNILNKCVPKFSMMSYITQDSVVTSKSNPISTKRKNNDNDDESNLILRKKIKNDLTKKHTSIKNFFIHQNKEVKNEGNSELSENTKSTLVSDAEQLQLFKFCNDIALFDPSNKTSKEKFDFIEKCKQPPKDFKFPKQKENRKCRPEWFSLYPWLRYSPSLDGLFCLPCVLFASDKSQNKLIKLVKEPFDRWSNAAYYLKSHSNHKLGVHKLSSLKFEHFVSTMKSKSESIDVKLDTIAKKEIQTNRSFLRPIIDSIKFCGRQGIPLRGHFDQSKFHPEVGDSNPDNNPGVFVELLNFRVRGGDENLKEHMNNSLPGASYISAKSQNEIISICGHLIRQKIIKKITDSKFYTVLCDEASDCSNKEQMSLVIRYVDSENNIQEKFLSFIECTLGLSGQNLCDTLLNELNRLGLDVANCRGQGYDGAGSVAGRKNGLSALFKKINPKALYTHCASHKLSLCVVKSCSIQEIKNMMNHIREITYFFTNSNPRNEHLMKIIKELIPETKYSKLVDVSRTRWIARLEGMGVFLVLFPAVLKALEDFKNNFDKKFNSDTSQRGEQFYYLLTSFNFTVTFIISKKILDHLIPVTKHLQKRSNDLAHTFDLIESLKITMLELSENRDSMHERWYKEVLEFANNFDIPEKKMRTTGKQQHRTNIPYSSTSEYFKRLLTIPLLDHLNTELSTRFSSDSLISYSGLFVLPQILNSNLKIWKEKFLEFAKFYCNDLPNFDGIEGELSLWQNYWKLQSDSNMVLPDSIGETLRSHNVSSFPNINICLRILGTLPTTTCECERSFSSLRHLKTWTRSTMTNDRLNGLSALYIHREIDLEIDEIIDKFAESNRKLKFK